MIAGPGPCPRCGTAMVPLFISYYCSYCEPGPSTKSTRKEVYEAALEEMKQYKMPTPNKPALTQAGPTVWAGPILVPSTKGLARLCGVFESPPSTWTFARWVPVGLNWPLSYVTFIDEDWGTGSSPTNWVSWTTASAGKMSILQCAPVSTRFGAIYF